jgi:hypothetical protein
LLRRGMQMYAFTCGLLANRCFLSQTSH